jgi:phosphodiesterase/alkaline phosphatase D-like protein
VITADPSADSVAADGSGGSVTVNAPGDTTPPVVSSQVTSSVTQTSATITWTTNENANAQVEYGQSASYGTYTTIGDALTTAHSQKVDGLLPDSTYHFRVKSRDRDGNLGVSGGFTLKTKTLQDGGGDVQAIRFFPRIPVLVGQNRSSGYIRLRANKPVASFALFGTNRLSVLSAVTAQQVPD